MRNRRNSGLRIYEPSGINAVPQAPMASLPNVATAAPNALGDLARAAAGAGLVVNEVLGREYYRDQTARVDDAVLEASRRFELWKAEYNEKMRGREGVNALEDYTRQYDEICDNIRKEFDFSEPEIFGDLLRRKLAERGLSVIREGGGYAQRQRSEWLASQWAAQMADFSAYVAANPDDADGIAFRRQGLMQSWQAKNPGLDPGGAAAELNGLVFRQRMEGFLANGDAAGARAWLGQYGRIAGLARGDSLQKWLLAHNNPGSVTVDGKDFAAYATARDGLKAIMGRFAAYRKKGDRNIRQMISRYAPPSENDTGAYIAQVARMTGLDPDKDLNIRDPHVLAGLTRAVLMREHGQKFDEGELLAAAEDFLQTGEPKAVGRISRKREARQWLPGLDPAIFRAYEERVAGLEKLDQAAMDQERATAILAGVRELPIDRRDEEILRRIQEMPPEEAERMRPLLKRGVQERKELDRLSRSHALMDAFSAAMRKLANPSEELLDNLMMEMAATVPEADLREEFKSFAMGEIRNLRERQAAADALAVTQFMASQEGKSPAEIQAAIRSSGLSPTARARASQLSWGLAREENPDNARATTLGLMLRDRGNLETDAELESYAAANNLTLGQVRKIREYRGNAAGVSIQRVNGILQNLAKLGDFDGPDHIDANGYQILLEQLRPGHEPSDQELTDILAGLYARTSSRHLYFFRKNVLDEIAEGQLRGDWLPEVKSWQIPRLEAILESRKIRPTDRNMRLLLKLNIFRQMGWPSSEQPDWDK